MSYFIENKVLPAEYQDYYTLKAADFANQKSPWPFQDGHVFTPQSKADLIADGVIMLATGRIGTGGRVTAAEAVPANPRAYSTLFEMELKPVDFGRSRSVHFNRANGALDDAFRSDAEMLAMFESEVPGIGASVSRTGGRQTPTDWTWEHASTSTANGRSGVMRLVPTEQHTPGSQWWRALHPDTGARGGYSEWAIPAGALKNR